MGKNQWVSPRENGWAVHSEGSSRDTKIFSTKAEAVAHARKIAKNQKSELIVQKKDGKIESKDSFGNDPFPPRDTEH